MYFDEHLGMVMTHIKDGSVEVKVTQMSRSMLETLMHSFDDIQRRNEATLDEAANIDNKDNNAKREWWKRRYDIDADMKQLIQKLDEIIAQNFTFKSLAKQFSDLSLHEEYGKADEYNSKASNNSASRFGNTMFSLGIYTVSGIDGSDKNAIDTFVPRFRRRNGLQACVQSTGTPSYKLRNGSFIINPEGNLPQTEKNFKQLMTATKAEPNQHRQLASVLSNLDKNGKIKIGTKPVASNILSLLKTSDILTYWGHDSLMKFTSSGKVAKLGKKTTVLFSIWVVTAVGCTQKVGLEHMAKSIV